MAWIIGKKSDESIVEVNHKVPDFELIELQDAFVANRGGVVSDYSFLQITDTEISRIEDGETHSINWVANEIDNVDFTAEESKPWAKISSNEEYIDNDGIDSATLTLEIWKTDLSEIDTTFQFPGVRIPIATPEGPKMVRFDIVNGTASKSFKTTKSGKYTFPGVSKRYNSVRIFNQIEIEVDDIDILS